MAELGFMVVIMDSRGTPMRHKAFQTTNYGWIPEGTQADDFRFGLEQLAQRYPQMDLDRVGIYSPTGYPGGIDNLMANPDFYGVGVVSNLMDTRLMSRTGEHVDKYEGAAPKCDKLYADERVAQWNGKLLLIQMMSGWASSAYSPAGAMRLIDALQQANKPIDMIVRSNDKASFLMTPYEQRRAWDYFVRHLQGAEPPHEFELGEFHQ